MVSLTVKVVLQGAENDSKYRDVAPLIAMCCLRWLHRVLLNVDARASVMFLEIIFDVSALQDD